MLDCICDGFVGREHNRRSWRLSHSASLEPRVERMTERRKGREGGLDTGFEMTHTYGFHRMPLFNPMDCCSAGCPGRG
jgi:hypothetical protein